MSSTRHRTASDEDLSRQHAQSPLAVRLRERIAREGAITFRDWMAAALYDEQDGYYQRADRERWGRAGDYRTSPERSPLFAATFARYFASLHAELGAPASWTIFEAGAGRGDFARGVLEALECDHPQIFRATRYVIDETGESARASAVSKLAPFAGRVEFRSFGDHVETPGEAIVFSNELLDAFPVHRVLMKGGKLRELCVGLDGVGEFAWVEREPSTPRLVEHFARLGVTLSEGQRAEVNLAAEDWIRQSNALITRGFVVTVDYGAQA
ncbi:MAG: hypothetical protein QOF61_2057, partial [Acidobacteriota bacterium]|nr:hypothetical protein [Acidobacteriota bacterium]